MKINNQLTTRKCLIYCCIWKNIEKRFLREGIKRGTIKLKEKKAPSLAKEKKLLFLGIRASHNLELWTKWSAGRNHFRPPDFKSGIDLKLKQR